MSSVPPKPSNNPENTDLQKISVIRLLSKALILLIIFNLLLVAFYPPILGKISAYNILFPGRERFPFGESPESYNLSLFDLDAMFKSQRLDGAQKSSDEYRVFVLGDSSVWGTLLRPEETLPGLLDAVNMTNCGRKVHVYNIAYPTIALTKDLMMLDIATKYQPDLVIWLTTLESFPMEKQLNSPIVANNPQKSRELISKYGLSLNPADPALAEPTFLDRTLFGQRRALMDLVRLQLYGVMWAATGIDQVYPADYEPAAIDLKADDTFHGMSPPTLDSAALAWESLDAGFVAAGDVPVLLVNEPILVSNGENSDIRYNFFYPRWAYDQYREQLAARATANGWDYLDLWNLVPMDEFTNSAVHLTPAGEEMLAEQVAAALPQFCK